MNKTFWRDALLAAVALAALIALQRGATTIYELPHGRFPAMMIEVAASRAITFNPGVLGYYERVFNAQARISNHHGTWMGGGRVFDPYRIYSLRPNIENIGDWNSVNIPTNNFGHVGPNWSIQKPPNTRRVALLGDSITEGFAVPTNQTYGALFENRLNATHPAGPSERFEIMNFAVAGYRLTQVFDVAEEDVPRFEPDVYVLGLTELSVFRGWDSHLVDMIALGIDPKYAFLRHTVEVARTSAKDDDATLYAKLAPFRIAVVRDALLEMKSNAERHHAQFVVLLVPSVEDADVTKRRLKGIPELLASLNITTVNLLDTFDQVPDVVPLRISREDVHPNAKGQAMIAANLYAKLRAQPDAWADIVGPAPAAAQQAASKHNSF
ncbi:MAG: SGNH/GDSL hydrolase family protein [Candidatus Acidiferrales bacterium]